MATTGSGTSTAVPTVLLTGSYTLQDLIDRWRRRLDDTLEPYLWSNDELTEYVDTLQKSLVAEIPMIVDSQTVSVCSVALTQGDTVVAVSPRILRILKARIDGEENDLYLRDTEYMDVHHTDWDKGTATQDVPHTLVVNYAPGKVFLYPPLSAATATLLLRVQRLPLLDLVYEDHLAESLELDRFAHLLVNGILAQAYMKQGTDTENPTRAEAHRVLWEGRDKNGGDKEQIRRMVLRERAEYYGAGNVLQSE